MQQTRLSAAQTTPKVSWRYLQCSTNLFIFSHVFNGTRCLKQCEVFAKVYVYIRCLILAYGNFHELSSPPVEVVTEVIKTNNALEFRLILVFEMLRQ